MSITVLMALVVVTSSETDAVGYCCTLPKNAVASFQVPAAATSLSRFESCPLAPLVDLIATPRDRRLVRSTKDAAVVGAVYSPFDDWILAIDGVGAMPPSSIDRAVATPFRGEGCAGVVAAAARVDEMVKLQATSPCAQGSMGRLVPVDDNIDLRGELDVQRWYGQLARSTQGRVRAGIVDRLGLLDALAVSLTLRVDRAMGLRGRASIAFGKPPSRGLLAAFAASNRGQQPVMRPSGGRDYVRISVRPQRVYESAELFGNYLAPLETALVRAHVDVLAARVGKRIGRDILGDEPRVWTAYLSARGSVVPVLVADVADAKAAQRLLEEVYKALPQMLPAWRMSAKQVSARTVYVISNQARDLLAIAAVERSVIVADSLASVEALLRKKWMTETVDDEDDAIARGRLGGAAMLSMLRQTALGKTILSISLANHVTESRLATTLGGVAFCVAAKGGALVSDFELGKSSTSAACR